MSEAEVSETMTALIWAGTILAVTGLVCTIALRAWTGWLQLQREELRGRTAVEPLDPTPAVRIEMANLKERLRKLEAIARGVDL